MRLLVISNLYPPHAYGGYEMSCRDVVERFRARGHDVTVLTSTARVPGVDDICQPHVLRLLRPYWDWEAHAPIIRPPWRRLRREWLDHRALARALAVARPDVVSVWHMAGLSLSLLTDVERRGLPMVLTICDEWPVYGPRDDAWTATLSRTPGVRHLAAALRLPRTLPALDRCAVDVVSGRTLARIRAGSPWAFEGAQVVHSGIDLADFPVTERPGRRWSGRLLFVGRLDPAKGVETLIRALPLLPDTTSLTILGGGNSGYRQRLSNICEELGLAARVRIDVAPRAALAGHYREADVVVFPSEWEEPFGLVPLEAMASGVPVVATGTGGSAEYLEDGGNCLLFCPGDAADLARAVGALAADAALRDRLVRAGQACARRLTVDAYAGTQERLHLQVVETASARSGPRWQVCPGRRRRDPRTGREGS